MLGSIGFVIKTLCIGLIDEFFPEGLYIRNPFKWSIRLVTRLSPEGVNGQFITVFKKPASGVDTIGGGGSSQPEPSSTVGNDTGRSSPTRSTSLVNNPSQSSNLPRYPSGRGPIIRFFEDGGGLSEYPVRDIPDKYLIQYIGDTAKMSQTQDTSVYGPQDDPFERSQYQTYWANRNQELRAEFTRRFPSTPISRGRR